MKAGTIESTRHMKFMGGFAIHASELWPFISALRTLEQSTFGAFLHEYGFEMKGCRLLDKDRFKWAGQGPAMNEAERRKQALNFLNAGAQSRSPRRDEFNAFGQACLAMAKHTMQLLASHDAKLFAAVIPCGVQPVTSDPNEFLRKDLVFLFERYFYFLKERKQSGLLVMDGTEKHADRKLVRRIERYFTDSMVGRQRTQWIVPVPLFFESDMAYGVQVADLCIYCLNWGYRQFPMDSKTRTDIEPFARLLKKVVWHGNGHLGGKFFKSHGVVYVPDPYTAR